MRRSLAKGLLPGLAILGFALAASAAGPAFIAGTVFDDLDHDGAQDPGEAGLAGVTITLDSGANGSIDDQTVTDASGNYNFNVVSPGTYRVRAVPPPGLTQTSPNPADLSPGDLETLDADFAFALISVVEVPALGTWGAIGFVIALGAAAWGIGRRPRSAV